MVVKTKQVLVKKTPVSKPAVVKRAPNKAIKNTRTKKTTPTHSSKVSTQLKLSSDAPKQGRVSVRIVDNTKTKTAVVKRTSIYPAVPSPFRFPVPTSKSISMVAYSFGLFFMALGTMLSAIHFPVDFPGNQISMMANTLSTYIEPSLTEPINKLDTSTYTSTSGTYTGTQTITESTISSEEARPEPHISIIGAGGTLVGNLQIAINVPRANEVRVLLDSRTTNQLYTLGNAQSVDASTWKAYFDTTKYPNGEYRLKVLVRNIYGTYDYADQTSYVISNELKLETTQILSEASTPSATTTTSGTVVETAVTPSATSPVTVRITNQNPVKGSIPIEVDVENATAVKVGLKNVASGTLYSTGFLNKDTDKTWKIVWDSTRVPDGKYILTPRASVSDIQTKGEEYILTIENGITNATLNTVEQLPETTTTTVTPLIPDITTTLSKQNPVSNFVDVIISTSPLVTAVEIYAIPQKSLTAHFLGLARNDIEGKWRFSWETTNSPNGEYYIYARVKTTYGFTEGGKKFVSIVNESINDFTNEQEEKIKALQSADDALVTIVESAPDNEQDSGDQPSLSTERITYIEPVSGFVGAFDIDTEIKNDIEDSLNVYREELDKKLILLAQAERRNDTEMLKRIREEIESLRNDVISTLPVGVEKKELIEEIGQYLSQVAFELTEVTIKNETILRERVGDAVMNDSDKDEISDYDEINLYKTNPFSADSDADGHNDNIEIVQGFNPLNAGAEVPVVYESPRETGLVRDDLLVVESIHTVERGVDGMDPKALISGKALPNSFVTLYIFSTPVVITVKTDTDGNWNYIFDKTLENGDHEVYVGITDNEGKIVAKSNPISFVKTAEAFVSDTDSTAPQPVESVEPSLVNSEALLTIGSILVLILGLVLIFVGLHLRREDEMMMPRTV